MRDSHAQCVTVGRSVEVKNLLLYALASYPGPSHKSNYLCGKDLGTRLLYARTNAMIRPRGKAECKYEKGPPGP